MSFTDTLKRSLGFEETETSNKKEGSSLTDMVRNVMKPKENHNEQPNRPQQQYRPNPQRQTRPNPQQQYKSTPKPAPTQTTSTVYDDFDDFVITPEQSFYEIVLIRPKTLDDINYIVDQVIEEKNPVILDLSFLEKESAPNFRLAGEKIKQMRARYGAQALLLSRSEEKNLIIISPKKVKVVNKG
ncbi:cell division protein SepF [Methanobrevibacter sp.]